MKIMIEKIVILHFIHHSQFQDKNYDVTAMQCELTLPRPVDLDTLLNSLPVEEIEKKLERTIDTGGDDITLELEIVDSFADNLSDVKKEMKGVIKEVARECLNYLSADALISPNTKIAVKIED